MAGRNSKNEPLLKEFKILFTVSENRNLGFIINACAVITEKNFFKVHEIILKENIDHYYATETEKKIINIINEYNENEIFKTFSKVKTAKEFYEKLEPSFLEERIRPYIEKRIVRVVDSLVKFKIPLFFKDKNYNTIHFDDEIKIPDNEAIPVFNFTRGENGSLYSLNLSIDQKEITLEKKNPLILSQHPSFIIIEKILFRVKEIDTKKLLPFFNKQHVVIPKSAERKYFESFIANAIERFKVNAIGFKIREINNEDRHAEIYLSDNLDAVPVLFLHFYYGKHEVFFNDTRKVLVDFINSQNEYRFDKHIRDLKWEREIIDFIEDTGLVWDDRNYFRLEETEEKDIYGYISWLNQNADLIIEKGIRIKADTASRNFFKGKIDLSINVEKKNDWFDITAYVIIGQYSFPFNRFRKYITSNIREFPLPDGTIAILPLEWFARYKDLYQFGKDEGEKIRIKNIYFNILNHQIKGIDHRYFERLAEISKTGNNEKVKLPEAMKAELRNYQISGYQWLMNLQKNNFGGCLADDMGLGKTIQTLAVLLYSKEKLEGKIKTKVKKKETGLLSLFDESEITDQRAVNSPTSLIVAPASLIHNWINEIAKFAPTLKICKFTGINRTREQYDFKFYDIVITTYGVVRNDVDILQNFYFHYIILDESQVVKNPTSKIYKAILKLQSEHKLVLTGTPIENSLIDLWSQLNFVNRGLLGHLAYFKTEFVTPIEKNNDTARQEKLKLLISPFIMRRNKNEVARDLPPVSEQMIYCEMTDEHAKLYEEEKSKIRNYIFESLERSGFNKSTLAILQGLSRLRQLANHPVMIFPEYADDSGKFNEICLHLNTIVSEGHKCLVFSSYVKHLELVRVYLEKENMKYSYLTGGTPNREIPIRNFQQDADTRLFLISLKAGGVGLNLTAADYVFVLDPWWNPAAEDQAISRAHRIGQDKNVFIYKFITCNTIEEKIQQLQERKSQLANLFINSNNPLKDFSMSDIKDLFR